MRQWKRLIALVLVRMSMRASAHEERVTTLSAPTFKPMVDRRGPLHRDGLRVEPGLGRGRPPPTRDRGAGGTGGNLTRWRWWRGLFSNASARRVGGWDDRGPDRCHAGGRWRADEVGGASSRWSWAKTCTWAWLTRPEPGLGWAWPRVGGVPFLARSPSDASRVSQALGRAPPDSRGRVCLVEPAACPGGRRDFSLTRQDVVS